MKRMTICLVFALCVGTAVAEGTHTVTFRRLNGTVLQTDEVAHGADATGLVPEAPAESGFSFSAWDHAEALASVTDDVTCWALYEATTAMPPSTAIASQTVVDRATPYSLEEYFQIYDNLAWSDEFSGSSLSVGSGKNWNYDTEQRNGELQKYTTGGNHTVSDGTLKLTCRRESSGGKSFTSGAIRSNGTVQFKYGRCEIRAKLTKQTGTWPAFWLLGTSGNWPNCGELDVFEQVNGSEWIGGNLHIPDGTGATISNSALACPEDGTHWGDAFHRIGVIMTEFECVWYVDDHIFKRMDTRNKARYPMLDNKYWYVLLNLAFGGAWPGQTDPGDASIADFQSEDYEIDYCRIFTNTTADNAIAREPEPEGARLSGPVRATVWRGWQMYWGKTGSGYYQNHIAGSENHHIRTALREYFERDGADIVTFLTRTKEHTGTGNLEMPFDVPGCSALGLSPEAGGNWKDFETDRREKLLNTVLFNRRRFSSSDSAISSLVLSSDAGFTNCSAVVAELVERSTGAKVKVVSVNAISTNGVETAGGIVEQGFAALMSKLDAMKDEKVVLLLQGMDSKTYAYLKALATANLGPEYAFLGEYRVNPAYQCAFATASYEASAANPAPLSVPKANGQASGVHTNQAYCATVDFNFPPPESGFSFGPAIASAGYGWTNGVATVTASVTNAAAMPEGAKVRLTVTDAAGNVLGTMEREWTGAGDYAFDTAGAIGGDAFADGFDYVCTFTLVDADGAAIDDDEGGVATAALRLGAEDLWFAADAAAGTVAGGAWAKEPAVAGGAYAIESDRSFLATESRDGFVRVEILLDGESTVSESELPELLEFAEANGERASLVAVQRSGGDIVWRGLVQENGAYAWKSLEGAAAPETGFHVALEIDMSGADPRVSYLVEEAENGLETRLHDAGGAMWFNAPGNGSTLSGDVDFRGTGRVAAFSGRVLDKAVAEADGVRYGSLAEALAAGDVRLLANAEWPADAPAGTIAIDPDGHTLLRGGVSVAGGSVVVDSGPVAIAGEGTVRISFDTLAGVGISPAGLTPAELAAALAETGANGIPKWQSYVLGLDAADPDARPYADIALDGDGGVAVSARGIEVNGDAGVTVTYQVYEVTDLADPEQDVAVGDSATPGTPVEFPMGDTASRFFRIRVEITLP